MPRLFSAIELPATVRTELAERLCDVREQEPDLRWVPSGSWHITLGFYGDREHVERRGPWFRRQATGLAPCRLRLRGAGRFPGVLWIGVSPADRGDLAALYALAGALNADTNADRYAEFTAHLTVARWRRGAAGSQSAIRVVHALTDYHGSWWSVPEVVLFRSDQPRGDPGAGPRYTALDRVTLAGTQR